MKNNEFLFFVISTFCVIVIVVLCLLITYNGQKQYYENCITYHENLSVVEANKTCNAIMKGNQK